jgi:hypothetical protein
MLLWSAEGETYRQKTLPAGSAFAPDRAESPSHERDFTISFGVWRRASAA